MTLEHWTRTAVVTFIVMAIDRPTPLFSGDANGFIPGQVLPPVQHDLASRIEELTRHIVERYGPAKPSAFTAPVPGISHADQAALENAVVDSAVSAREAFLRAIVNVSASDALFTLVPSRGHGLVKHLRGLVERLPEDPA
jgi:hypothetical protein